MPRRVADEYYIAGSQTTTTEEDLMVLGLYMSAFLLGILILVLYLARELRDGGRG